MSGDGGAWSPASPASKKRHLDASACCQSQKETEAAQALADMTAWSGGGGGRETAAERQGARETAAGEGGLETAGDQQGARETAAPPNLPGKDSISRDGGAQRDSEADGAGNPSQAWPQ